MDIGGIGRDVTDRHYWSLAPSADCVSSAFPGEHDCKYLILDRDAKFSPEALEAIKELISVQLSKKLK